MDVHSRSCNFLLTYPTPGKSSWQGIGLLHYQCSPVVSSQFHLLWRWACVGWGWYTCPMYDGYLYTRECQPLMQQEEVSFGEGCVTFHVGLSLHKRECLLQPDAPPPMVSSSHLSLIFLFPLEASAFTSTRSPVFKFMAPIFLTYYHFCQHASAVNWACTSHRVILNLSQMEATYLSNAWQRPLSWEPQCCQQ